MMQRPRTPSLTGNTSFSELDTESLSDVSNDNVDLYGSSLDQMEILGFVSVALDLHLDSQQIT